MFKFDQTVSYIALALAAMSVCGSAAHAQPAPDQTDATTTNNTTTMGDQTSTTAPQKGKSALSDVASVPTNSSGGIADIVVTAQKRAESLSKTPLAITAIGQATLDDVGAKSVADATRTIPNLQTTTIGNLAIRGIGTSIIIPSSSPAVAYHVDGVYSQTLDVISAPLWDIERVEVLRGPQGTLYGRNATAGVVNVITAKPVNQFVAFGDVSYGSFNDYTVRGVLNVPITNSLQVRFSGQYEKNDGYQSNPYDNSGKGGAVKRFDGRAAVKWTPFSGLTWNVNASLIADRSLSTTFDPNYFVAFPVGGAPVATPYNYPRNSIFLPSNSALSGGDFATLNTAHRNVFSVRSNLRYDFTNHFSATYVFGYQRLRELGQNISFPLSGTQEDNTGKTYSHELDFNYDGSRFRAVGGVYDYVNRSLQNGLLHIATPDLTTDPNTPPGFTGKLDIGGPDQGTRQSTKAVFGQATYDLTDRLHLTGGIRYNRETVSQSAYPAFSCPYGSTNNPRNPGAVQPQGADPFLTGNFCANYSANPTLPTAVFGLPSPPLPAFLPYQSILAAYGIPQGLFYTSQVSPAAKVHFERVSWKAGADYDLTPDTLVYATVATGFKTGGIAQAVNTASTGDNRFFQPETNINYELGVRSKLFNNRVSLNLTGFWTDYRDLQVGTLENLCPASNPGCPDNAKVPTNVFRNAASARSRGLEFEGAWAITPNDRLSGFATYLDARFRSFPDASDVFDTAPNGAPAVVADAKGNRLPASPEWTFRAVYQHIFHLGSAGMLTPTIQTYHQSVSYAYFTNGPQDRIGAYWRSDLLVRYETLSKSFFVEAFVNNIENKRPITSAYPFQGIDFVTYGIPRTGGVRVGVHF